MYVMTMLQAFWFQKYDFQNHRGIFLLAKQHSLFGWVYPDLEYLVDLQKFENYIFGIRVLQGLKEVPM